MLDLGLERARGVVAHLAPAHDGQVGVHRAHASARRANAERRRRPAGALRPRVCGGSSAASAASIVSVTRRSVMRATSGASTKRLPRPVSITIPSKMCSRALSSTRWTVPTCAPSEACDGHAARERLVADLVVVVVRATPEG